MDELSDKQAVEQVLQGDREAFRALVDRYKNLVYRLAIDRLGDRDGAEDVVQEVFVTAFEHLERLHEPNRFGAWVASIARNRCVSLLRRRGREPATVSLEDLGGQGCEPAVEPGTPGEAAEQSALLRRRLGQLPAHHREILTLRYIEEFSCERLASFLALSHSAVLTRLFRARQALLTLMEKEGDRR